MWDYTEEVKEHFLNPRNVGDIENPDGVGQVGSLACGDALRLSFKLDVDGRIADCKFRTFGCASAIASSSALTELIKGMTLEEAEKVTNNDIAAFLGGLPPEKMHCSVMGKEALEAAIANYRTGEDQTGHQVTGHVICTCFGVTEFEIEEVVKTNDLHTIEDVTNYNKAGGACGRCHSEIQEIIDRVRGEIDSSKKESAPLRPNHMTNIQRISLIQSTIETKVRPSLKAHGGDVELIDIVGNDVIVQLTGVCTACPMTSVTLKEKVEGTLRKYVSEDLVVKQLEVEDA